MGLTKCDIYGGCAQCPAFGDACDGREDAGADGINENLVIEDELSMRIRMREGAKITVTEAVIRDDLDRAIECLKKNYKAGKNNPTVRDPVAWALYKTWRQVASFAERKRRKKGKND